MLQRFLMACPPPIAMQLWGTACSVIGLSLVDDLYVGNNRSFGRKSVPTNESFSRRNNQKKDNRHLAYKAVNEYRTVLEEKAKLCKTSGSEEVTNVNDLKLMKSIRKKVRWMTTSSRKLSVILGLLAKLSIKKPLKTFTKSSEGT